MKIARPAHRRLKACHLCRETAARIAPNYSMANRLLAYTPNGYMSAQLMRADPGHFASGDWFKATPTEYARFALTYFAYAGPLQVHKEIKTVIHFVLTFGNGHPRGRAVCCSRQSSQRFN